MAQLLLGGRSDGHHAHVARVEPCDEAPDGPALARGVEALEEHQQAGADWCGSSSPAVKQAQLDEAALRRRDPLLGLLVGERRGREVDLVDPVRHRGACPCSLRDYSGRSSGASLRRSSPYRAGRGGSGSRPFPRLGPSEGDGMRRRAGVVWRHRDGRVASLASALGASADRPRPRPRPSRATVDVPAPVCVPARPSPPARCGGDATRGRGSARDLHGAVLAVVPAQPSMRGLRRVDAHLGDRPRPLPGLQGTGADRARRGPEMVPRRRALPPARDLQLRASTSRTRPPAST